MQKSGYFTAIRGKVSHSTPFQPYHWDADLTIKEDGAKEHIKDVASYATSLTRGIAQAQAAHKPFAININISDPHKPFWFEGDPHGVSKYSHQKSRLFPAFYLTTLLSGKNSHCTTHRFVELTTLSVPFLMPLKNLVRKRTPSWSFSLTMACRCHLQNPAVPPQHTNTADHSLAWCCATRNCR